MGSLFGSRTPAPPPPPPPATLRDEVGRVEQVPVTQADGSVTYVTRRLPLTPEEQARRNELNSMVQEALVEIRKLSASDYAEDDSTRRVLDQWQSAQRELLDECLQQRRDSEETVLARRGLGDSTAASAVRRQRALDEQRERRALQDRRQVLGQQVRGERLALQQNLFNLASGERELDEVRSARAALQGQSSVAAVNAQRQASVLDYYQAKLGATSRSPFESALGQGLGASLGRGVGTAMGGPVGGAAGSLLGSWLWRR